MRFYHLNPKTVKKTHAFKMMQNRLLASFVVLSNPAVNYLWNTLKLQTSFFLFVFFFFWEEYKMVELH